MAFAAKQVSTALSGDPFEFCSSLTVLNKAGATYIVGTPTVTVRELSDGGHVKECTSAVAPTNGDAGYFVGCTFINTTGGAGGTYFINVGSSTSATWLAVDGTGSGQSAAINSTGTATAAQVATGRITSTSAAATVITLPTGTLLGAALGAVAGTVFDLIVDNTAGANTVTIAVAVNGVLSDGAVTAGAIAFGDLTIASGTTGVARFTLMFSSATAYAFSRTA